MDRDHIATSDPLDTAGPSAAQIEAYRRDGFLVVEQFLTAAELERARSRWAAVFAHEWATGVAPDEVNYDPSTTPPDRTRQLCNVWKSDPAVAQVVLSEKVGRWTALLSGEPGTRICQDNLIWKPPSGKALLAHQDGSYLSWLAPANMTTCWMALDDTHADTGTIFYVRGSHTWPRTPVAGQFHAPDDWLTHLRDSVPDGEEIELVPIEVPAGGAAFHDAWTFHGSPPNERADRERRAIISHTMSSRTEWADGASHAQYSRYRRFGERTFDEGFFPILWREDGYRSPWIAQYATTATTQDQE